MSTIPNDLVYSFINRHFTRVYITNSGPSLKKYYDSRTTKSVSRKYLSNNMPIDFAKRTMKQFSVWPMIHKVLKYLEKKHIL